MSFILEALRKSEHERQRQAGPGIAELPIARPASRPPVALIAVGGLLAINLVIVLVLLLRQGAPELPAPVPDSTSTAGEPPRDGAPVAATEAREAAAVPRPAAARAAPPPEPVREVRPLVEEAAPPLAAPDGFDPPPAPDPSLVPTAPVTPAVREMPRGSVSAPPPSGEFVPRIDSLPPQATAGLPALNLDLHIYATQPSQRSVFINGRRYGEGDSLPEGVRVESITTDGAVLQYRGQRFLLPRQ
jgi:general secretion pathway protein B